MFLTNNCSSSSLSALVLQVHSLPLTLVTFDKTLELLQELDVLLMLDGGAQLTQLISEGVVNAAVGQEVHQVVVQRLRGESEFLSSADL